MADSPPPLPPLAESVGLFERSATYALEELYGLTDAGLDRPTPCTGWDLRKLALHLAASADGLADLGTTGKLSLSTPPQDPDPVGLARDRMHHLLDTFKSVMHGEAAPHVGDQARWACSAAQAGAIEFAAHGWDIATARDADRGIPDGLATELLALSAALLDDQDRRPQFGPPVDVPASAPASDRLVAFLGRDPAPRS
ncbi:TIGR03086 family metal-binding protein [Actinopolymorpha pittospori]|uniref:Uncharacterized protein (TIGR03086 family) n=1 Tax=Actinopolymorpha pittospori TaxID=648752 RepID=A0A927MU49_9ACTN|nr:uncharacterized protein (TIGR03086 family) [Actinopolymorpha pittospori]